ncbi:MAG: sugar phosphate isomerase/epimerase family protein, partial [Planctomycetota bacterium]
MLKYKGFILLLIGFWAVAALVGCGAGNVCIASESRVGAGYEPRVAVQLYVFLQDRHRNKIDHWEDLDGILSEVKSGGARAVEGFLDWFDSEERADRSKKLLAKHNLALAGLYTGGVFDDKKVTRETIEKILTDAGRVKDLAPLFIDVNPRPLPKQGQKTDEQLATQVLMLNELGMKLAKMNMQLVIHQHAPEILHNGREHRYNVEHVDGKYVGFCLDTHWVYRGGEDPLTFVREAGSKLQALHLRNSINGVWGETLGPGDVDYVPIAEHLRKSNYKGWLILELAHEKEIMFTRSLTENVREGLKYLESLFLGEVSTKPKVSINKDFSTILGATHASGKYYFTSRDFVNEGAIVASNAGMRVIKLWLEKPAGYYLWNCNWPDEWDSKRPDELPSLVELVKHPHFGEIFNRPFDTYVLTCFERVDVYHGLPDPLPAEVERNYYDLAQHLLIEYRGTGKTFIIGHHEGDWHLRQSTNRAQSHDPGPEAIEGMIRWYRARQRGVDRAKADYPDRGVNLYHAAEVNLVNIAMEGRPSVTNDVLPQVNCDLVSYSAYDTTLAMRKKGHEAHWRKEFRKALEYIDSKVADKAPFGSKNIFISEYGGPEQLWGGDASAADDLLRMCRATVEEASDWGCPYIVFWQVYCNECCEGGREPCRPVGGTQPAGVRPAASNDDC